MKANKNFSDSCITKRFCNMVAKFNEDLQAFADYCGDKEAYLYEDITTTFTLSKVRIEGDYFVYNFDGEEVRDLLGYWDEEEGDFYSNIEEVKEQIKFWRACIRRAKKYFSISGEDLDAMQEAALYGEEEAEEEGEEAAAEYQEAAEYQRAKRAEAKANQAAEAAELIAEDATIYARRAESWNKEGEAAAVAEYAKAAEEAAADAAEKAAEAAYFSRIAETAEAAAAEETAAKFAAKAAEEAKKAAAFLNQEAAAPEYQEAAADLVKTAAAVAFGFIGFYFVFAIFGV